MNPMKALILLVAGLIILMNILVIPGLNDLSELIELIGGDFLIALFLVSLYGVLQHPPRL